MKYIFSLTSLLLINYIYAGGVDVGNPENKTIVLVSQKFFTTPKQGLDHGFTLIKKLKDNQYTVLTQTVKDLQCDYSTVNYKEIGLPVVRNGYNPHLEVEVSGCRLKTPFNQFEYVIEDN